MLGAKVEPAISRIGGLTGNLAVPPPTDAIPVPLAVRVVGTGVMAAAVAVAAIRVGLRVQLGASRLRGLHQWPPEVLPGLVATLCHWPPIELLTQSVPGQAGALGGQLVG